MAAKLERINRYGNGCLRYISQHWFKFAQRLSQALLIPIAILPAAGVMIGLASNPLPFIPDAISVVMLAVGKLIFTMMPMLFAVAVSIGFCKDQGIAAFTAVFGFGVYLSSMAALAELYGISTRMLL